MHVLILGASGFIGFPVAQAFVRAGHIVYGQTRSASKVNRLGAEEIIPIVSAVDDVKAYASIIPKLDVVIDAIGGMEVWKLSSDILAGFAQAVQEQRPPNAPKIAYIYTSGTWVHGDNRTDVVTDTTPLTNPAELVAWRPDQEQRVVTNLHLNGIVIRPSLLYGRSGSLLAMLFGKASQGNAEWFGTPGGRLAAIHCDDLAQVYLLAAEKSSIAAGKIFDASNDVNESTDAVLQRLVEISGAKGYRYIEPTNLFEKAITTTTVLRPYLARTLLGWQPRKAGLLDYLDIYYSAWKASEGLL